MLSKQQQFCMIAIHSVGISLCTSRLLPEARQKLFRPRLAEMVPFRYSIRMTVSKWRLVFSQKWSPNGMELSQLNRALAHSLLPFLTIHRPYSRHTLSLRPRFAYGARAPLLPSLFSPPLPSATSDDQPKYVSPA